VDGVAGTTVTANPGASSPAVSYVGWDGGSAPPRYLNGYIDDLRITKGVARYTANFTPPAATLPDF
jgi:hypothetical protein